MKKGLLSAILAAVLLVSGCSSGVSQESYNSVVEENTKLQSEKSSLEAESSVLQSESSTTHNIGSVNESEEAQSTSNSSNDETNSLQEYIDSGKIIVSPSTGVIWAYSEELNGFTADVSSGVLKKLDNEDEIIQFCYLDAIYFACSKNLDNEFSNTEQYRDRLFVDLYWYDGNSKNNTLLGYCRITYIYGASISNNCIQWGNEWEKFNSYSANQKMIKIVENFDFNSNDGHIEIDGYKINFTGEYVFSVIDNQFSKWNNTPVIKIAANIENVSSKYKYCVLYCNVIDPNGNEVENLDAYFDDGIVGKEIEKGNVSKRYFVIPYTVDGEYTLEFFDHTRYKIEIKKPQ